MLVSLIRGTAQKPTLFVSPRSDSRYGKEEGIGAPGGLEPPTFWFVGEQGLHVTTRLSDAPLEKSDVP